MVISFACHTDEPQIANACHMLGIPYAIVLQAAGYGNWIRPQDAPAFRSAYANARQCYFVSDENRHIIESNLVLDLSHAEIVDNPFMVRLDAAPRWPSTEPFWKLAYVARIHFVSKSPGPGAAGAAAAEVAGPAAEDHDVGQRRRLPRHRSRR